ncbi:hypothetical protein FACS189420_1440 [Bacteroidia bacterium]|nr:hypothetical protein FACS189420_1440 [Bacteroidia bacterium]
MQDEIQCIISGNVTVRYGTTIQTALCYLERSKATGALDKNDKRFKREETKALRQFVETNNLWINVDIDKYVSEGAEQKVYLKDEKTILKLNDAIYYLSWVDYFHNLLLNNHFFPNTAYKLLGFFENEKILYAVVEQAFIKVTEKTDLENVRRFMQANGFECIRNNDYVNYKLGIIIEDLHDENVLTNNGILYFIDTVIYIQDYYDFLHQCRDGMSGESPFSGLVQDNADK